MASGWGSERSWEIGKMAGSTTALLRPVDMNLKLFWNMTSTSKQQLTCVCRTTCQLAFLLPILGHDRLCEAKEVLQWAAVRAARQAERPGGLVTLIPKVHLH